MIVSAIFSYVYLSTSSYVRSRSDHAIMAEYSSLRSAYDRSGRDGLIDLIQQRLADKTLQDVYILADPRSLSSPAISRRGRRRRGVRGMDGVSCARAVAPGGDEPAAAAGNVRGIPDGDRLLVGRDISDLDASPTDQDRRDLRRRLIFVLAGVASILVTRRTVGRIESINATSRAIMQSGLDKRIPLRGTHDEWDRVAENLNLMLDRIETLMGEVKQVSDNVAHDLRTPLTRMRGRLEKAYHGQRTGEADQALIGDTIADLDAVLADILVDHADRADRDTGAQGCIQHRESGRDRQRGRRIIRCRRRAGRHPPQPSPASGEVLVTGDRDLIFDAIANLVDNAIKHGRAGGEVVVKSRNHRWPAGHLDRR